MLYLVQTRFVVALLSIIVTGLTAVIDSIAAEPTTAELAAARRTYAKHGLGYMSRVNERERRIEHIFVLREDADDSDLEGIPDLPFMFSLVCASEDLTDEGMKAIGNLKHVTSLDLHKSKITDAGLKSIVGLTNLTEINLANTKITDDGVRHIKKLRTINSLNLAETRITDDGLKDLKDLTNLVSLALNGTATTDAGLHELKMLAKLRLLTLSDKITAVGLTELKNFKMLKHLQIIDCKVTDAQIADLQRAIPDCHIDR